MRRIAGFTLIEVLVVLAIVATLLSLVTPRYFDSLSRAQETALKHDLLTMRDAIDKHYADLGAYPDTLEELVQRKYLRAVPEDPITKTTLSWVLVPPEDRYATGQIYSIRSGAEGTATDGTLYADW